MESFEFDFYDYWDELQYGEDEYWDQGGTGALASEAGQKRKRGMVNTGKNDFKRRKLSLKDTDGGNVRFVDSAVRIQNFMKQAPMLGRRGSFALLPDWRKRFENDAGVMFNKEMPDAMKNAAEGKNEVAPQQHGHLDASAENEEWEDEDEEVGMQADLATLDPETLKAVLKQNLGNAGLEGLDEAALMSIISKMLAGDEGADSAAGDMANTLLEQATQSNDTALSGWLSQQGVSLDAAEEEEGETSSVATGELPTSVAENVAKKLQVSPPDSAIGSLKGGDGASKQMAIHSSSPSGSTRKRPATVEDGVGDIAKKRKRVSFEVNASSDLVSASQEDTTTVTQEEQLDVPDAPANGDTANLETTTNDEAFSASKNKASNSAAVKTNGAKPRAAKSKSKLAEESDGVEDESNEVESEANADAAEDYDEDTIVVAPAPAKNTRKRKAEAHEDEGGKTSPRQRKQAKKASTRSAPARSTRAATRAGK